MLDTVNELSIPEEHRLTFQDSADPAVRWYPPGTHKLNSKEPREAVLELKQNYAQNVAAAAEAEATKGTDLTEAQQVSQPQNADSLSALEIGDKIKLEKLRMDLNALMEGSTVNGGG